MHLHRVTAHRQQTAQLATHLLKRFASDAKIAYGAPFTNSIALKPSKAEGASGSGLGSFSGADTHTFMLSVPDYPMGTLTVYGKDHLDFVASQIGEKLSAGSVRWVINGQRLNSGVSLGQAGEPATLNQIFGNAVELEIDGVRYSINDGAVLNALGKASKRSLATTYAFVGIGGVSVLLGCLYFWTKVVPKEQQRKM